MNSPLQFGTQAQINSQVRACGKCRFSRLETMPGQIQRVLVCHRFPPSMSLYVAPGPGGQMGVTGATNHLVVLPISWCDQLNPWKHQRKKALYSQNKSAIVAPQLRFKTGVKIMARGRVVAEDEREDAVVIESRGAERDHNGLIQIGDRDSEIAWDDWIAGLRESEGTGTITAFKLPVDAEGNPTQGRGTRQARLGAWPHVLFNLEELSDKIIKGFLKPGETAHIRFVGTQPGTRGTIVQKIVTLSRSSDEPEHENEFASAMKITQEALDRQAQMMERLLVKEIAPQPPQRDWLQTAGQLATILAPILTPLVTHLATRQPPKSDLANLMETMLKMKEFIGGESSSNENDSAVSIVKAAAPGAMQLLATLAAQRQPIPQRHMIARTVPGTEPTRLNAPAPAMTKLVTPVPMPPAQPKTPTTFPNVESDEMLAQLLPQLETLAQIAETGADPNEVAKLVLDSVPETFDEKLWELVSDTARSNRLFILAPKLNPHKEWMEKLRVALVAEYTDDLPAATETTVTEGIAQ